MMIPTKVHVDDNSKVEQCSMFSAEFETETRRVHFDVKGDCQIVRINIGMSDIILNRLVYIQNISCFVSDICKCRSEYLPA